MNRWWLLSVGLTAGAWATDDAGHMKALRSPVVAERIAAAQALGAATDLPASAIAPLIEATGDEYYDVRTGAAAALQRLGAAAVPSLTGALATGGYHQRRLAVQLLGQLGPAAAPAVPALGALLRDDAAEIRAEILRALLQIGQTDRVRQELLGALADPSDAVRELAAQAVAPAGQAVVPDLAKLLRGTDAAGRDGALRAVAAIGPAAAEALPAIVPLLQKDLAAVQREAGKQADGGIRDSFIRHSTDDRLTLHAVTRLGVAGVPVLVELLKTREPVAVRWGCVGLERMGASGQTAAPELLRLFQDAKTDGERNQAIWTLGRVRAIEPLVGLLKHETPAVRKQAANTLASLGTEAAAAVPALRAATADADPAVKAAAEAAVKATTAGSSP